MSILSELLGFRRNVGHSSSESIQVDKVYVSDSESHLRVLVVIGDDPDADIVDAQSIVGSDSSRSQSRDQKVAAKSVVILRV